MTDAEINDAVCLAIGERTTNKVDYANALDCIVPVVREWCRNLSPLQAHNWGISGTTEPSTFAGRVCGKKALADNPARALCLAFLQAVEALGGRR